ncbi:TetR/AcrR family transcriptional regulator [Streptomyces albidoflavus]|uniref:TetR/AcrR family transcriptional regulator n=1 Tax=Streptomyces albidoflavus TaxID=1886 RepID=UPI00101E820D|nr:helix-turn-helix domain-containing protein [Streptomyces albidoflavus]RZD73552.1 TetR family transcriptional regulator [Streptomyces albidoflavus]RZD92561.1 TetR family transcriptional regulator [Streptomyces albidoflavus]
MTTRRTGLREQKKQATRAALREAALRLALEHGPENVRVDDIADAAGVSPRTYNNYFSSREQAIVAAITAEREARIAEEVTAAPAHTSLADALTGAILVRYTEPGDTERFLVTATPPLREAFLEAATELEGPLADAIGRRLGDTTTPAAPVLAAAVAAAVRIALHQWLGTAPAPSTAPDRLVIPSGSLPDLLRAALAPLAPALDAAEAGSRRRQAG